MEVLQPWIYTPGMYLLFRRMVGGFPFGDDYIGILYHPKRGWCVHASRQYERVVNDLNLTSKSPEKLMLKVDLVLLENNIEIMEPFVFPENDE